MVAHVSAVTAKVRLRSQFKIIDICADIVDCLKSHAVVHNVIPDRATVYSEIHLNTISTVLKSLHRNHNLHVEVGRKWIRPLYTRLHRTTAWCITVHTVIWHHFIVAHPSITRWIPHPRLLDRSIGRHTVTTSEIVVRISVTRIETVGPSIIALVSVKVGDGIKIVCGDIRRCRGVTRSHRR
jgi:hypothetical protein